MAQYTHKCEKCSHIWTSNGPTGRCPECRHYKPFTRVCRNCGRIWESSSSNGGCSECGRTVLRQTMSEAERARWAERKLSRLGTSPSEIRATVAELGLRRAV